jgi:hypothetical protein
MARDVDLVTVCRLQALRAFPQSPLKRLIPLVREVTKLRVVFEINISFANTECKTLTRIRRNRRRQSRRRRQPCRRLRRLRRPRSPRLRHVSLQSCRNSLSGRSKTGSRRSRVPLMIGLRRGRHRRLAARPKTYIPFYNEESLNHLTAVVGNASVDSQHDPQSRHTSYCRGVLSLYFQGRR